MARPKSQALTPLADAATVSSGLSGIEAGIGEQGTHPVKKITRRSLLGEILDWMLAPLFLLWPMSVAITYIVAQGIANTPYDQGLQTALAVLGQEVRWSDERHSAPTIAPGPVALAALRHQDSGGVFWKAQWVNATTDQAAPGTLLGGDADLPTPRQLPDSLWLGQTYFTDQTIDGFDVRLAYQLVTNPRARQQDPVLLVVGESRQTRVELANTIIKGVIIPQFLVLPVAVLLIWFGLSRGVAPINALQRRLRARRPDDLSAIDDHAIPAEITPLVTAMNELLGRLSSNIAAQQRFVADAAHQLKTPLAALRLQADLAMKSANSPETEANLRNIVAGTTRATRLINQLLLMASAENQDHLQLVPLQIAKVAREVTEQWVPRALAQGIDLGFEANDETAMIRGQQLLLIEVLNNLIDNALRYAPNCGDVTVAVRASSTEVQLDVRDHGPGIAQDQRERVFDRFYRALGTQTEGSGLGLAIVKEIMQKHRARIDIVAVHPGRASPGTIMRLTFRRER